MNFPKIDSPASSSAVKNHVRTDDSDWTGELRDRRPSKHSRWQMRVVCLCVCLRVVCLLCAWDWNWVTARLSLQSHFVALERRCRWMSLGALRDDANSATHTDAECRFEPSVPYFYWPKLHFWKHPAGGKKRQQKPTCVAPLGYFVLKWKDCLIGNVAAVGGSLTVLWKCTQRLGVSRHRFS